MNNVQLNRICHTETPQLQHAFPLGQRVKQWKLNSTASKETYLAQVWSQHSTPPGGEVHSLTVP